MDKMHIYKVEDIDIELEKRLPPNVIIKVKGFTSTPGWHEAELVERKCVIPSLIGVYVFDFVATPPDGVQPAVLAEISASTKINLYEPNEIRIIIIASSNIMEFKSHI